MAKFDVEIEKLLGHEGGYVNHPNDPGGETKWGISKRSYPGWDIKGMTRDEAKAIYKKDYWEKLNLDGVDSQALAGAVFSIGVNMGVKWGGRLLQRAYNSMQSRGDKLAEDGIIGHRTLGKVNAYWDTAAMVNSLVVVWKDRYRYLISKNPKLKVFKRGWFKRANDYAI